MRKLEHVIQRCVSFSTGNIIDPADLPKKIIKECNPLIHNALENDFTLAELDKEYILEILGQTGWNKTKAASKLGITRATLLNKLKMYNGKITLIRP